MKAMVSAIMIERYETRETAMDMVGTNDYMFDVYLHLKTIIQEAYQSYAQEGGVRGAYRSTDVLEELRVVAQILWRGASSFVNTTGSSTYCI